MKKIFTAILFFLIVSTGYSQLEISSYTATGGAYSTTFLTDYQCIGVNPANLGWTRNDHSVNLGFAEFGVGIFSAALTKKQVLGDMFNDNDILTTPEQKAQAAADFTDAQIWAQAAVTMLGVSYQHEKVGGFAISIRDRMLWNSVLNDSASSFLFEGYNFTPYFDSTANPGTDSIAGWSTSPNWASNVYQGTNIHAIWYREYSFAYGRKIMEKEDFTWYGGIAVRYISGYGSTEYRQDGSTLNAYSSLSPIFEVDYDEPSPSLITDSGLKKVGDGVGVDIGFTFLIKQKAKVGISLNDIGCIWWNGNVYQGNNVLVSTIESAGLNNYNIFSQGQLIVADNAPGDPSMWTGLANKKVSLPMHMRVGASWKIIDEVDVGLDSYIPLNKTVPGHYEKPAFSLGTHYDPAKWVQLSLGFMTGGNRYGLYIPFGVTFTPVNNEDVTWQLGIATRDMISWFKQTNAMPSFAFGFLRFSFGTLKGGS